MLGVSVLALATGCSKKSDTSDSSGSVDYDVTKLVDLADYKGLELEVSTATDVTDEEVQSSIDSILASYSSSYEKTDKTTVEDGDTVNIDYEGLLDGVAFEGGTAEGADLTIGSGTFIDGFESGLIGKNVGEVVALNLTFPEEYSNTDLAGKAVVFNVTINYVEEAVTPVLDAEFIKEYTGEEMSEADFREKIKQSLVESKESTIESNKINAAQTKLLEESTITVPEDLLKEKVDETVVTEKANAKASNLEFSDYLSQNYNITEDEFNEQVDAGVESNLQLQLLSEAIAEKEGISITEKEYKTLIEAFVTDNGLESVEAAETQYGKDAFESYFLQQEVWELVVDSATFVEPAVDNSTTEIIDNSTDSSTTETTVQTDSSTDSSTAE